MSHKFRTGQKVTLAPARFGADRQGTFEIVRLLPEEHGVYQYRLKSALDGRERVATEEEISKL